MAVPKFFEFFVPTLKALSHKDSMKIKDLRAAIADDMGLSDADKAVLLPSGKQLTYVNRIQWSIQYLKNAGLVSTVSRGEYAITTEGLRAYQEDADKIDIHYLNRYDSFRRFHGGNNQNTASPSGSTEQEEITPLESIEAAYTSIRTALSKSLIQ